MRENVSWLFFNANCILIVGINDVCFYIDIRMTSFNVYTICTNIEIIVGNGNVTSSYIYSWTITVSNRIVTYNGIFSNINSCTTCIYIRIWNNILFYNGISSCINCIVPTIVICISTIPCTMDSRKNISYNLIAWLSSTNTSIYIINSIVNYIIMCTHNLDTISKWRRQWSFTIFINCPFNSPNTMNGIIKNEVIGIYTTTLTHISST